MSVLTDHLRTAIALADAETTRADNAERMVAELREHLLGWPRCGCDHPVCKHCRDDRDVASVLSSTADVAGRWVPVPQYDQMVHMLRSEREAAIAARDEAVALAALRKTDLEMAWKDCDPTVDMCGACAACVDFVKHQQDYALSALREAERARDEVGIQLVAAKERLRLADVVVSRAAALAGNTIADDLMDAVNAYRAVPGDALAPPHDTEGPAR